MQLSLLSFKKTITLFFPYLWDKKKRHCLLFVACLVLFDILAASIVPFFSKKIAESIAIPANTTNMIFCFVIFFGIFWTIERISLPIQEIVFFPIVNNAIRDITGKVVHHIHQIPMEQYQNVSCPEILSSIKRISLSARNFIKIFFLMLIPTMIKFMVVMFICMKLNLFGLGFLSGVMLCGLILYHGIARYISTRNEAWELTDQVMMRVNDSIQNTKLARFFIDLEMQQVNTILQEEAFLWNKTNVRLHLIQVYIGVILGCSITFILIYAGFALKSGTLTFGNFILLQAQLLGSFIPLKTLALELRQLAEAVIDISKIRKVLEMPLLPLNLNVSPHKTGHKKAITAHNISFCYHNQRKLFSTFNLNIIEGEKIALYGKNGTGKSTLLEILSGLLMPQQGEVFIYDRPKMAYSSSEYQKILHYIPQDVTVFNQTLRHNILYGCQNISDELLFQTMEICGLGSLISKTHQRLDTDIGNMGIRLSFGEKQRLALVRALLLKPKILLLDETLDSLKIEQETHLLKALFSTIPTIIAVSHHPYVLQSMQRAIPLADTSLDLPIKLYENDSTLLV